MTENLQATESENKAQTGAELEDPQTTEEAKDATRSEDDQAEVQVPEFQRFSDSGDTAEHEMSRFGDIKVSVSAELGRVNMPIERLMKLGRGSVLELDRMIDQPIELIAQGIPLASGEVVVVDGHFAVRILKVYPRNRRGETLKGEQ